MYPNLIKRSIFGLLVLILAASLAGGPAVNAGTPVFLEITQQDGTVRAGADGGLASDTLPPGPGSVTVTRGTAPNFATATTGRAVR